MGGHQVSWVWPLWLYLLAAVAWLPLGWLFRVVDRALARDIRRDEIAERWGDIVRRYRETAVEPPRPGAAGEE